MNAQAFDVECRRPFASVDHDCAEAVAAALKSEAPRLYSALTVAKSLPSYARADAWTLAYTLARQCGARCVPVQDTGSAWGLVDTAAGLAVAVRDASGRWWHRGYRGPRSAPAVNVLIAWECV